METNKNEMLNKVSEQGSVILRGVEIATRTLDIDVRTLKFYADNPRIYSFMRADGVQPTQDDILAKLQTLEHVRELVQDIRANGGLIDPLVVRDGDFVVLEGNSRLAAYHHLIIENPLLWSMVRCTLLPADIDEKSVFALLAQYHVKGKKDWAPYEKAGFVYRRFKNQKVDIPAIAKEIGLTKDEAKHLVAVYEFMIEHGDSDRERWSYYDEFLKSRKIRKVREEVAGFDEFIVSEIQAGHFGKAMELRDKLPVICTASTKIVRRYMDRTYDFTEAHEAAVTAGGENHVLNKVTRFKNWLVEASTEDDILDAPKSIRDRIQFQLKEIEKKSKKYKELIEAKKNEIDPQ